MGASHVRAIRGASVTGGASLRRRKVKGDACTLLSPFCVKSRRRRQSRRREGGQPAVRLKQATAQAARSPRVSFSLARCAAPARPQTTYCNHFSPADAPPLYPLFAVPSAGNR